MPRRQDQIDLSGPGWKTVTVSPTSENVAGTLVSTDKLNIPEPGFGVEILSGAQFVQKITFWKGQVAFEDLQEIPFDGRVYACPVGFDRITVQWANDTLPLAVDTAQTRSNVTLKIIKVPAVHWTNESGIGAQGAVRLYKSQMHYDPASAGVLPSINAGASQLVVDGRGNQYQLRGTGAPLGGIYPNRMSGDFENAWFPTPALYLGGYVGATQAFELDILGVNLWVDPGGVVTTVTTQLHRLTSTVALAGSPVPFLNNSCPLLLPSGNRIPLPQDGFLIYLRNTSGVSATFAGAVYGTT